ncbi:hypothetical protein IQ266_11290 [filamentous cyanobacterium LEGE 11480]|uniref:RuBisCO accumulation factor 1 n=2 Tax=Romeriopsis TaxID=2992131 RepID=A0A928Z2F0_9CYAN|nr:hypothetical protein [Romeriopsis navalis LEGE 11480]
MVGMPQDSAKLTDEQAQAILLTLRRKEGNWVAWAESCQTLQKSGWNAQQIFEETGFEPIQQNQIMGAAQVYASMVKAGVPEPVEAHFAHRASDVLYEFRVLTPADRAASAEFAFSRQMDRDDAHELARAMKDFSRLSQPPVEFTNHPGDVVAYFSWQAAKHQVDLQARSLLIAKGLKFAQTDTARQQIERLLTDFTAVTKKRMPLLPVYRLDSEEELPRIIPVVGELPLTAAAVQAVPVVTPTEPFGAVQIPSDVDCVPIPGWQVIRTAEDPVVVVATSDQLPTRLEGNVTPILIVLDRAKQEWNADSYFLAAAADDQVSVQWLDEAPRTAALLGKVVLVMRPKKIFDEGYSEEIYQWDE